MPVTAGSGRSPVGAARAHVNDRVGEGTDASI